MKFILLVEGETEAIGVPIFIGRWLETQFEERIGVHAVKFPGWPRLYQETPARTFRLLTGPNNADIIAVVSLLDLYGPTFYPEDCTSVAGRWNAGRAHMAERVRDYLAEQGAESEAGRYRHYFAVHETEAWLLAQPTLFGKSLSAQIRAIPKRPEQINFNEPPSKLLKRLYLQHRNRTYGKTTVARNLFPRADVQACADRCDYLKQMLVDLRGLALATGAKPRAESNQTPQDSCSTG